MLQNFEYIAPKFIISLTFEFGSVDSKWFCRFYGTLNIYNISSVFEDEY